MRTMGARPRNNSLPKLRLSHPSSTAVKTNFHPNLRRDLSIKGYPSITKWMAFAAGLVIFTWVVGIFTMISLHFNESSEQRGHLPVSISTIRGSRPFGRHGAHHDRVKRPKHYFQLSPPTATNFSTTTDSPPWSWPIIHIVNTRFMQGQGTLTNLARSRLKLLETVTFPSLMKQTIFNLTQYSEVYEHTKWEEEYQQLLMDMRNGHRTHTDPPLIWIIKVDPDLDKVVLSELKAILKPIEFFTLVVGSNTNYGIGVKPGGWRDGQAGQDVLNAYDDRRVYFPAGDVAYHMLRRAHEARSDRVVIETRLDADDAINVEYAATLQWKALRTLLDTHVSGYDGIGGDDDGGDEDEDEDEDEESKQIQTARWLYWCPQTHVQWNPSDLDRSKNPNDPGMLAIYNMPQVCVTSGLTLGFAVETQEDNVPRYEHSKVYWEISVVHNNKGKKNKTQEDESPDKHDCGLYPSSRCAVFVTDPLVSAFRSRAMTSAGMLNIEEGGLPAAKTPKKYRDVSSKLWRKQIEEQFGIQTTKAKEAADYMAANFLGTVRDNLRGQCTHGHSCKMSTYEKLQRTIDLLEEETGGVEVNQK